MSVDDESSLSPAEFTQLKLGYAFHSATVGHPSEVPANVANARYYRGDLHSLLSRFNHFLACDYGLISRVHEPNSAIVLHRTLGEWSLASLPHVS